MFSSQMSGCRSVPWTSVRVLWAWVGKLCDSVWQPTSELSRPQPVCVSAAQQQANPAASSLSSLSSLRNRPPQQSDSSRPVSSNAGYRSDYEQYSQYQQQQMYPGYYSSWGYDQSGYPYSCQLYDYSQYPASQVSHQAGGAGLALGVTLLFSHSVSF